MNEATASSGDEEPSTTRDRRDPARGSRIGGLSAGLVGLGIVTVLLVVFILQNTESAEVTFLGWTADVPLAVALLAAAAAGLLLAGAAGSLRIWQLRRRIRHDKNGR